MSEKYKKYMKYSVFVLLGLLSWMAGAHTEEAILILGEVPELMEEAGPEHGKIHTPDASPVDPGHVEIESSYAYTHTKHFWDRSGNSRARGRAREQVLCLAAAVGVVENFDIAVGGSYMWLKDADYDFEPEDGTFGPEHGHDLGDIELSGRYRFFEGHDLELAYLGGVTLPTGSSSNCDEIGTSQEFWSFNQTLVASKDWGKWTANAAVGYALPLGGKRENARGTFNADAAVGYQVLPWLQPEIELNYCHDFLTTEEDSEVLAATIGLVMPINEELRIHTGVQQGLWGQNADKATTLILAAKLAF